MQDKSATFAGLQFLKLGGSLITEKSRPHTARVEVLERLAQEIASAWQKIEAGRLVLGHGSGSFGHTPARHFGTRLGVHTPQEWRGFIEVWREAAALNRLVVEALTAAGLPVMPFQPSASVIARDGRVAAWDLTPLRCALEAGLLPVVYGDVIFDLQRGGTILSTEDLFAHLARQLRPLRILLAGLEDGVWQDYPARTRRVEAITPENYPLIQPVLSGSDATDVTGGMASKVQQSLELVREMPGLEIYIFSGEINGAVERALTGEAIGTLIHRENNSSKQFI
jgi:isopentenyl phosphate kinase